MSDATLPKRGAEVQRDREVEALLCCARTSLDSEGQNRLRALLKEGLDWERLLQLAFRHKVAPLLYRNLTADGSGFLPQHVSDALQKNHRVRSWHNHARIQELSALSQQFQSEGIPFLALKGPIIAMAAYGDLSLREFDDLDLLVRPEEVSRVREALLSHGYQAHAIMEEETERVYLRKYNQLPFRKNDPPSTIEIHWKPFQKYYFAEMKIGDLLQRSKRVALKGQEIPSLGLEDQLLYLCVHGSKHGWARLSWICDVAELIRRGTNDIDWPGMIRQAEALGSKKRLLLGLFLAQDLLAAPLPPAISEAIQSDDRVKSLAADVSPYLFHDLALDPHPASFNALDRINIRTFDSSLSRIRFAVHLARRIAACWMKPEAKDRAVVPLPASLSGFYYLIRPFRLAVTALTNRGTSRKPFS